MLLAEWLLPRIAEFRREKFPPKCPWISPPCLGGSFPNGLRFIRGLSATGEYRKRGICSSFHVRGRCKLTEPPGIRVVEELCRYPGCRRGLGKKRDWEGEEGIASFPDGDRCFHGGTRP